jgi:hypothetical protein
MIKQNVTGFIAFVVIGLAIDNCETVKGLWDFSNWLGYITLHLSVIWFGIWRDAKGPKVSRWLGRARLGDQQAREMVRPRM